VNLEEDSNLEIRSQTKVMVQILEERQQNIARAVRHKKFYSIEIVEILLVVTRDQVRIEVIHNTNVCHQSLDLLNKRK
jgi:hypothetical protein